MLLGPWYGLHCSSRECATMLKVHAKPQQCSWQQHNDWTLDLQPYWLRMGRSA